jgi:hypothetical protein
MNNMTYSQMNIAQAIFLRKRNMYKLMNKNNKITCICVNHVYINEQYNEQCQYITNSNNSLQTHRLVTVTFLNPSIVHTCIKILFVARA